MKKNNYVIEMVRALFKDEKEVKTFVPFTAKGNRELNKKLTK